MLLRWEDVRRGDLVALSGQFFFVVKIRKHDIEGPPPGPTEYWSVRYLERKEENPAFKTMLTFESQAELVGRRS